MCHARVMLVWRYRPVVPSPRASTRTDHPPGARRTMVSTASAAAVEALSQATVLVYDRATARRKTIVDIVRSKVRRRLSLCVRGLPGAHHQPAGLSRLTARVLARTASPLPAVNCPPRRPWSRGRVATPRHHTSYTGANNHTSYGRRHRALEGARAHSSSHSPIAPRLEHEDGSSFVPPPRTPKNGAASPNSLESVFLWPFAFAFAPNRIANCARGAPLPRRGRLGGRGRPDREAPRRGLARRHRHGDRGARRDVPPPARGHARARGGERGEGPLGHPGRARRELGRPAGLARRPHLAGHGARRVGLYRGAGACSVRVLARRRRRRRRRRRSVVCWFVFFFSPSRSSVRSFVRRPVVRRPRRAPRSAAAVPTVGARDRQADRETERQRD